MLVHFDPSTIRETMQILLGFCEGDLALQQSAEIPSVCSCSKGGFQAALGML
jgi:hypothetical protein